MRYIKVFTKRGGGSQNLHRQEGGLRENLLLPIMGGGGVKKHENPAYIVYERSLNRNLSFDAFRTENAHPQIGFTPSRIGKNNHVT